ncbi:hypothetical protein [Chitinimonas sp.]|uniref:hypothetical protein n=1 Tax=Chitinimonas sp. TaxID=1934313 RepID=UPI002F92886A
MQKHIRTMEPSTDATLSALMKTPATTEQQHLKQRQHKREVRRRLEDLLESASAPKELW